MVLTMAHRITHSLNSHRQTFSREEIEEISAQHRVEVSSKEIDSVNVHPNLHANAGFLEASMQPS